ncbi:MAG: hypothetical protein LWX70_08975 [Sphingobacteriia bacterium]|nr:hypothetical protein [Sphingobacteriia bacterium]
MKKTVVRRISKSRINAYLRSANTKLTQEEKLAVKIAVEQSELEQLKKQGVSNLVLKGRENNIRKLNSELFSVRKRRLESERRFEDAVRHNDSLNGGDNFRNSDAA